MNKNIKIGTEGPGLGVLKLSAEEKKHLKELVKPLEGVKRERVPLIYPMYKDGSVDIVNHFDGKRAPNQWPNFESDARQVNNPDDPLYAYFKALTGAFTLNEGVDSIDILLTGMEKRAECGVEPFGKDSTNAAVVDFGKVFLYEKITDEDGETIYTPVIAKQIN